MTVEKETIQILLDLLNPLHGDLDKQTYDVKVAMEFDAPPDYAHDVTITAQQERDLTQAVCILENRLCQAAAPQGREALEKQVEQLQAKLHCMCGSPMDHSAWEGHSPVSMYDYALDRANERIKELEEALTPAVAPDGAGEALHDIRSHCSTWRHALCIARDNAPPRINEVDDKAYWEHEIKAFDRTFAALAQAQEPGEDDTLTDALVRVIDSWRKTHPDLSYFETLTVIEGIGRTLRNLRDDAEGRK